MSRAPFDGQLRLIEMLRSLTEADVDFLVFGAVAGSLHGYVRGTSDLDVILDPDLANLDRATRWLIRHDARLLSDQDVRIIEVSNRLFRRGEGVTAITDLGELDMIVRLPGLPDWSDLVGAELRLPFDDLLLRVVDRETLIASKRRRATPVDLDDVAKLEALDD